MDTVLAVIAWIQTNWLPALAVLVTVDQVLIGIFPKVPFFGSLGDALAKLTGKAP